MIHKIEIEGEVVYLKKNIFGGYRTIYPVINEDKSFNWFNFITGGSWGKLISIVLLILLILFFAWAYRHDISKCDELIRCGASCIDNIKINLSSTYP